MITKKFKTFEEMEQYKDKLYGVSGAAKKLDDGTYILKHKPQTVKQRLKYLNLLDMVSNTDEGYIKFKFCMFYSISEDLILDDEFDVKEMLIKSLKETFDEEMKKLENKFEDILNKEGG